MVGENKMEKENVCNDTLSPRYPFGHVGLLFLMIFVEGYYER